MSSDIEPEQSARKHVCARMRGELTLIPIGDVIYFQADQKYVTVRHSGGEVVIEESLKSLERDLSDRFIRIHRTALVAKSRVAGVGKSDFGRDVVALRGVDDRLPVSRRNAPAVRRFVRGLVIFY